MSNLYHLQVVENTHKYLWLLTSTIISTFSSFFPQVAELTLKAPKAWCECVCSFHSLHKSFLQTESLHPNKVIKPKLKTKYSLMITLKTDFVFRHTGDRQVYHYNVHEKKKKCDSAPCGFFRRS